MDDRFYLEDSLGFLVNRAATILKNELARSFKAHGYDVTPEQFAVLTILWENEAHTQSELAERLVKDKTNLTRILDGMEKRNLIVRRSHEHDRRSYHIYLTTKGKELKKVMIPLAREGNERSTKGLDPQEKQALRRFMTMIYQNLS